MSHQNQRTTSMNSNLFTQILAEEPHSSLLILCGCPVVWSGRVCCMWAYVSTSNSEEIIYLGFVSLSGKTMTLFSFLLWNTYLGKTGFCEPVIYWKYYSASIFLLTSHLLISESWKTRLLPLPQITIVSPDKMRKGQYLSAFCSSLTSICSLVYGFIHTSTSSP